MRTVNAFFGQILSLIHILDPARYGQIMKQAMGERKAGVQVLVSMMNKNKKFQKEQLNKEGYNEFVEFYNCLLYTSRCV